MSPDYSFKWIAAEQLRNILRVAAAVAWFSQEGPGRPKTKKGDAARLPTINLYNTGGLAARPGA
jgi:hypothetical protein